MHYEEYENRHVHVAYCDPQRYTPAEVAEIFTREILDGLLSNDLDPRTAAAWATHAFHYGRLALDERAYDDAYAANEQHQRELQRDTPLLMRTLIDSARLAFSVPEPKGKL